MQSPRDRYLRIFFDEAVEAMAILDDNGCCIDVNRAACRLLNSSREQLLGHCIANFVSFQWNFEAVWQSFQKQGQEQGNVALILSDASLREIKFSITADLEPHQHLLVLHDISDCKAAEIALQQQAEREQALHNVVQAIRSSLELDAILTSSAIQIAGFLQAEVSMVQYLPEQECWRHRVVHNQSHDNSEKLSMDIPDTGNPFAEKLKQLQIVKIDDTTFVNDPINRELAQVFPGAWLLVPISINGIIWGSLTLARPHQNVPWQTDEIALAQQVADQLAIAIQQANLYSQVQQLNATLQQQVQAQTAELEQALQTERLLKCITDQVRDSLDEDQILETVVRELGHGLNLECCDTGIYNPDRSTSTITHEFTRSLLSAKGVTFPIATAPCPEIYHALLQGQLVQFSELMEYSLRSTDQPLTVLACPIRDDQRILGDLWLFKRSPYVFSTLEVRLVEQVVNQCAIALRQSRLYQAAQAQVTELERLNRLKDDFLSTVSHELRTPISNIKMATELLEIQLTRLGILPADFAITASSMDDPIARYFLILKDEGQREISLINDLLDLARIDAQTEPLVLSSIDLQNWLPYLLEPFLTQTQQQQQHLMTHLPPDLSPITTDASHFQRILRELFTNACKYTPPHETISVSAQVMGDTMEIRVANSGVEISEVECNRIFDRFYRIPNHDPWKHGGTGLGLALVKKLVEYLSGSIWVESSANQVQFVIQLPLLLKE